MQQTLFFTVFGLEQMVISRFLFTRDLSGFLIINNLNFIKMRYYIIVFTALMLILTGFAGINRELPVQDREVPAFSGISISVAGKVYIRQGPVQKVTVEGSERVLEDLITEVRSGRLNIRMPSRWNFRRNDELTVYITVTELESLAVSGSASVFTETPIRTDDLTVAISGSGRVEIGDLSARNLETTISGSGRLNLAGNRNLASHRIVISGSGRVESASPGAEKADITISGSGRCTIHALSELNIRISGSGRVYYTGNPLVDAKISGSGRVISDN